MPDITALLRFVLSQMARSIPYIVYANAARGIPSAVAPSSTAHVQGTGTTAKEPKRQW